MRAQGFPNALAILRRDGQYQGEEAAYQATRLGQEPDSWPPEAYRQGRILEALYRNGLSWAPFTASQKAEAEAVWVTAYRDAYEATYETEEV